MVHIWYSIEYNQCSAVYAALFKEDAHATDHLSGSGSGM